MKKRTAKLDHGLARASQLASVEAKKVGEESGSYVASRVPRGIMAVV